MKQIMNGGRHALIVVFFFACLVALSTSADELRDYLKSETHYWGIAQHLTEAELDQLTSLKRGADAAGLNQEQRTKAYRALFEFVQRLRGQPAERVPAALAASYWAEGRPLVPKTLPAAHPGELGNFKKVGSGKISVILIPDLGADSSVFEEFMQRNQSRFTFYAVTLPGFGGTAPPRRPDRLDFQQLEWWNNAVNAILELIKKQNIHKPILLGHQAGAYLAMKLAVQRPDAVRGVMVLNGLLYMSMGGIGPEATPAERAKVVNSWVPVELFPNTSREQYIKVMSQGAEWFCKDKQRQQHLLHLVASTTPSVWWNYFAELATTNLSQQIRKLKVPMLVLISLYDAGSPGVETSKTTLQHWNSVDRSLPITIVPIQDSRAYAMYDQPQKVDEAIKQWVSKFGS